MPANIEVSCGFAAQNSKEITAYRRLITEQDYSTIRINLYSGSPVEIILSAVALKELALSGKVILTKQEQKRLQDISISNQIYTLCFTCTLQLEGTCKELFSQNHKDGETALEIIKSGLFRTQ